MDSDLPARRLRDMGAVAAVVLGADVHQLSLLERLTLHRPDSYLLGHAAALVSADPAYFPLMGQAAELTSRVGDHVVGLLPGASYHAFGEVEDLLWWTLARDLLLADGDFDSADPGADYFPMARRRLTTALTVSWAHDRARVGLLLESVDNLGLAAAVRLVEALDA